MCPSIQKIEISHTELDDAEGEGEGPTKGPIRLPLPEPSSLLVPCAPNTRLQAALVTSCVNPESNVKRALALLTTGAAVEHLAEEWVAKPNAIIPDAHMPHTSWHLVVVLSRPRLSPLGERLGRRRAPRVGRGRVRSVSAALLAGSDASDGKPAASQASPKFDSWAALCTKREARAMPY